MNLATLTDFMAQSFNDRHFSFEDHQNFQPVIEELVFYTKDLYLQNPNEIATLDQALTLMRFGSSFDV